MLVSEGLSMGLSVTSVDRQYVGSMIDEINNYLENFIHNIGPLEPVADDDPMAVRPRMVKIRNAGLIENIMRIFPLPDDIWDDTRIINLINKTNFPDYYYKPGNHDPDEYIYPLPSFELFPKQWHTSVFQAFGDKDNIGVFLRIGDWPREECTLRRQTIQTQLNLLRADQQTYYHYRLHPGYMGPNKKGSNVFINWKCNTLVGHESLNPDTEVIDTLPEEQ
jgi:hypothetical protein